MFAGVSIWQLLIILLIILAIFGTKKLRNIGGDLGGAVKGFKDAMNEGEAEQSQKQLNTKKNQTASSNETADKQEDKA